MYFRAVKTALSCVGYECIPVVCLSSSYDLEVFVPDCFVLVPHAG